MCLGSKQHMWSATKRHYVAVCQSNSGGRS